MASITIRRLDDTVKARLRIQAAQHGHSMEEEAREILSAALKSTAQEGRDWVDRIRSRFEPLGGMDLKIPPREPIRKPTILGE